MKRFCERFHMALGCKTTDLNMHVKRESDMERRSTSLNLDLGRVDPVLPLLFDLALLLIS